MTQEVRKLFMQLKNHKKSAGIIILLVIVFIWWITASSHKNHQRNKTLYVKTATVIAQPMPIQIQAVGTIAAKQAAAMTPQVSGILQKMHFQEGQVVSAGQLLFEIDASLITATLQQTQANLSRDKAQLAVAIADEKRYAALVKQEYVTRQQYEQARATAKAQEALVAADMAQIKQTEVQLGYTKIYAPITGKTGNVTIKPGELVTANTTPLVTINQLDPIYASFSLPQEQLSEIQKYQQINPLLVTIFNENNQEQLATGKLVFIDNTVYTQTGTVLFKAEVPNSKQNLWPGEIVTVRLILATEPNALVIPVAAVQRDQQGAFVYVVKQSTAQLQRITIARQIDNLAVVKQGLQKNDQVILDIPPNLNDGSLIAILP